MKPIHLVKTYKVIKSMDMVNRCQLPPAPSLDRYRIDHSQVVFDVHEKNISRTVKVPVDGKLTKRTGKCLGVPQHPVDSSTLST